MGHSQWYSTSRRTAPAPSLGQSALNIGLATASSLMRDPRKYFVQFSDGLTLLYLCLPYPPQTQVPRALLDKLFQSSLAASPCRITTHSCRQNARTDDEIE